MNDRGYSKLFSSIVTSSLWGHDSDIRIVWVTILALKNQYGDVMASVPGLARAANVSLEKCEAALAHFLAPDKYSRTKTDDGRRIVEIPGGWRVINNDYYNNLMTLDERKEYKRRKEAERRARIRGQVVDTRGQSVDKRGQENGQNGQVVGLHGRNGTDTDAHEDQNVASEIPRPAIAGESTIASEPVLPMQPEPPDAAGAPEPPPVVAGAVRQKRAKLPGTESGILHGQFFAEWGAAYENYHGAGYKFGGGRDGKAVKELVAHCKDVEELIALAQLAWTKKGRGYWNCENNSGTISKFAAALNEIRRELKDEFTVQSAAPPVVRPWHRQQPEATGP